MKADEAHKLSDEEIEVEAKRIRRHLYDLRTQRVTEKIENTSQFGDSRRDLARLLTERRQRQIKAERRTQES